MAFPLEMPLSCRQAIYGVRPLPFAVGSSVVALRILSQR